LAAPAILSPVVFGPKTKARGGVDDIRCNLPRHLPLVSLFFGLFVCSGFSAPVDKLPAAGRVLDRYVSVTGGAALWHAKRVERDEIEGRTLDGQRVVLRATITVSRAGNSVSEIRVPQAASEGIYKGVAWADSRFSGVRIKRGMERDEAIRDSRMLEEADWRELYPKSSVAAIEWVAGERCYKVLLLPSPTQKTEWFSADSGLLVKRSSSELSTSGDTPVGYTVEDWAERGGVKQPSAMLAWRGDFQYSLKVLSTAYDMKHSELEYPAEVGDYLKADRAGKALPNAEEIIERHIFESGGPEFYEMLKTQKVTGTLTFLARNLEGHMEIWAADGGKYYQSTDIPGMGKQEEGSDGVIAWDRSPVIGPRLKPQHNAASLGVTMDAIGMIEWRSLIDHVRTEAEERIDDHDCYRVRLAPRDGSQDMIRWYDRATGLLYRSELAIRTDMGELPIVMTFEAYRNVAEVKWPSRIRIAASGQDTLFAADEVKLNEPVDDAVFEIPAEIRELARKRADAESPAPEPAP
jgi:hypothetical protein